jgi:hypothetical protein
VVAKKKSDTTGPTDAQALRDRWMKRITRERKAHEKWRKQAEKAEAAYRDEAKANADDAHKSNPFPIFWSTVQITHAAIFAKPPKPDVRKRYSDEGTSEDRIAQAVQRGIEFTIDTTGFSDHGHRLIDDYLIGALGIGKVEVDTEVAQAPVIDPTTQQPIMDDAGEPVMQKIVKRQSLRLRHFHWSKFGWEPGKDWEAADWERFEHDMTPDEVKDRFGIDLDPSNSRPEGGSTTKPNQYEETVTVHEVWDKKKRQQLFISDSHPEPLEVNDDPMRLDGFYPNPKPMMLNVKADELVPKPDYQFVQRQCENIQRLSGRIHALTRNIKDVGFYDAQLAELAQLNTAIDGTRVPIKNLAERLNAAGPGRMSFDAVVANQDNTNKVNVLRELISQRDIEKNALFEVLGIADIVRGASVASETAAAQTIKSQWANVRIGPKVQAVSLFFRDVFRIMGEIMSEHFEPEQLDKMSGMQLTPEESAALKDDLTRTYAIDIESDSTMASDDQEEKTQRLEMVSTLTDYLSKLLPLVQTNAMPAEMVKQTLLFVLRSFKYGRQLEESIGKLPDSLAQLQQLNQQMQQCQQQLQQSQEGQQKAEQQLQAFDQQKAAREDALAQAEITAKNATARKTMAESAAPPSAPAEAPPSPIEVEKVKIDWFDAETRRMAVTSKPIDTNQPPESEVGPQDIEPMLDENGDPIPPTLPPPDPVHELRQTMADHMAGVNQILAHLAAPKKTVIMRDKQGNIVGAEHVHG